MKNVLFLASGNGGNMKFIHLVIEKRLIPLNVRLCVVSDRDCDSLRYAKENDIENYQVHYNRGAPCELQSVLKAASPDIIVSNWHKIIDEETVSQYKGKIINLHYSLLPAFPGLIGIEPIKRAYEQGCRYTGATCHLVDEGVDTGKILSQTIVRTDILMEKAIERVFRQGCLILLNELFFDESYQNEGDSTFSPKLSFDENLFNDNFWRELSQI